MNTQKQARIGKQKIEKPAYKFLIGFIGGFCAAAFPRLMAALTLQDSSDVVLLSAGYLSIAVLFAVMIGAVVMIMEWGVSKEPSATFMTALGLPALLAGALNTSNGAFVLDTKSKENIKLAEAVQSLSQMPEVSFDVITPLSDAGVTRNSTNLITMNIIGVAYAGGSETNEEAFDLNPSMKFQQQQYYIILDQATGESEAKQRAIEIQPTVSNAQAVKSGSRYFVIVPKAMSKSEAVLQGIELQKKGFRPSLLEKK